MTTRLIVKNLPQRLPDDKELRDKFSKFGTITDCSMKYTKEGKFRKIAFIGFDTEEATQKSIEYYNQTYFGHTKITVELCKPFGAEDKPRPWSKYAPGSSAYKRLHEDQRNGNDATIDKPNSKKQKIAELFPSADIDKSAPKYQEFLRSQGVTEEKKAGDDGECNEPGDLVHELFDGLSCDLDCSVLITGLPSSVKSGSIKKFLAPIKPKLMRLSHNKIESAALVTFPRKPDQVKVLRRNNEYFGGFKLSITEASQHESGRQIIDQRQAYQQQKKKSKDEMSHADRLDEQQKHEMGQAQLISETGRLFIRNLAYTIQQEDIENQFSQYGPISEVNLPKDREGRPKGFAFVSFMFPENAVQAYEKLDGTIFKGRMLHVIAGEEARTNENAKADPSKDTVGEKSSFKKDKQAKLKAAAGKAHNWNTLFLGADAVADMIARKMDTKKSDLLNAESESNLAVRMALAETRLVRETREFLLSNGVQLDSFSRPSAPRSNTVLICKNLPADTTLDKLRPLFERFGELGRVLLPPEGGVSALVEFIQPSDASKALKALAYSRFGSVPLFLEWAPGDVFGQEAMEKGEQQLRDEANSLKPPEAKVVKEKKSKKHRTKPEGTTPQEDSHLTETSVESKELIPTENDETDEATVSSTQEPDTVIFVKNLSFDTTDQGLKTKFEKIGPLVYATVSKRKDRKQPDKFLSMGFGFVQFQRTVHAQKALKELQGTLLNGHCLELKLSHRQTGPTKYDEVKKKQLATIQGDCTKILVRNVPFEAKRKDIEELFTAFGELSFVRLPQKLNAAIDSDAHNNQHRGFAFVQFMTKEDARKAFTSLCHSTHLYGRRLVLEWAKEDDSLDELRAKTRDHFATGGDKKKLGKERKKIQETLEQIYNE